MTAAHNARPSDRALRADAQRNRQRIVEAAGAVFAERGLLVPLEEIADRAGVGIATLYRRFPVREELVAAVFDVKLLEVTAAAEKALQSRDPWTGFCEFVEQTCAMQAADRGFADVITMRLPTALQANRGPAYQATADLIRRTQEAGALREDFVPEDLLLLLMAIVGVIQVTRDGAPHAWRRLVAFVLEGWRASHTGPLPAAPTPTQIERARTNYASSMGICPAFRAGD
jgi:AcrR family transcriptional regulator